MKMVCDKKEVIRFVAFDETGLVYFFFLCKIVDVSIFDVSDDFVSDRRTGTIMMYCTSTTRVSCWYVRTFNLFLLTRGATNYYWFEVLNF